MYVERGTLHIENSTRQTNNYMDKIKNITIVILLVLVMVLGVVVGITLHSRNFYKHNNEALQDSVHYYTTKNGELMEYKKALIVKNSELAKYLDITTKEKKEIEKELKSKIDYIARLEGSVRIDSVLCHDTLWVRGDTTLIGFAYSDKWLSMEGTTTQTKDSVKTQINTLVCDVPLTVGLTDNYTIFVKSPNPYVSFSNIEGAVVEKPSNGTKPKRWNIGIQAGFGATYGLVGKTLDVGPYIGVGISYGFGF